MTQNRAERAADEIIARESATADAARSNKRQTGTTSRSTTSETTTTTVIGDRPPPPDRPRRSTPPYFAIVGGLLLAAVIGIIGFILLNGGGGQTANTTPTPSPTASSAATATIGAQPTPTPTPTTQVVVTPSASPSASPTPPTEVANIDDFFNTLGVDEPTRIELAAATVTDPPSDWVEPDPQLDPAQADIVAAVNFEMAMGPGFVARLPACTGLCAGGTPTTGEYYVYGIQTRGPIAGAENAFLELGISFMDRSPMGGGPAEALDQGPLSFLTGTNAAYSARFPAPSTGSAPVLFRLSHNADEPFLHQDESTAFALVLGNVVGVFIPEDEWSGAEAYRLYAYFQQTEPLSAVSDTYPDMSAALALYSPSTTLRIAVP